MVYQILTQGGIGDLITYLARLGSLLREGDQAEFSILGGFPRTFLWQKEILSQDERVRAVHFGEIGEGKILDWRPDNAPLRYPIQIPFKVRTSESARRFADSFFNRLALDPEKTVVIHPRSSEGNARGFESGRHWEEEKWQKLISLFRERGLRAVLVGSKEDFCSYERTLNLIGNTSVLETIALVEKAKYCVGINSWVWEVAAYAGHPTVVFFFVDKHFIRLHVPEQNLPNLALFSEKEVEPGQVIENLLKGEKDA